MTAPAKRSEALRLVPASSATPKRGRDGGSKSPGNGAFARAVARLDFVWWLAPSLVLVLGVVAWPVFETVRTSFQDIGLTGSVLGWAGGDNYSAVFADPALPRVLATTAVWVVVTVLVTTVVALGVASLLWQPSGAASILGIVLMVPWATSAVMTAIGFRWITNFYYGSLNPVLLKLGVIAAPVDWLGNEVTARWVMISVAVFISLPFTTFALLSGLNAVPPELIEAAHIDGAGSWTTYRHIVLPMLRGPLQITLVLNTIWVFNSFPIIYVLNKSNPGYGNDTLLTYMYKVSFITDLDVGKGAAIAVLDLLLLLLLATVALRKLSPR